MTLVAVTLNDDFGGRRLFPADNWWNQEITSAPIDPQSAAFIDFVGRTRTLHPDFGPPPYGIPYVGVRGSARDRRTASIVTARPSRLVRLGGSRYGETGSMSRMVSISRAARWPLSTAPFI